MTSDSEPSTLPELIRRGADRYPERQAAADGSWRCTYGELAEHARRMARLLHDQGVRKGDRVALLMPPSVAHLVAFFGAAELGAIPVTLHARESEPVLAELLRRLSPRCLVYDGAFAEKCDRLRREVPWVTGGVCARSAITPRARPPGAADPIIPDDLSGHRAEYESMPAGPEETAVIALSSGTTGIAKGVMHSHRALLASARLGAHYMAAHSRAVGLNTFTTAFIGWYNCTLPFLYGGSKICYLEQWNPVAFLDTIAREKVTVCFLVPTMWRMVLQALADHPTDFSSLERVGYAGEPMDQRTMAQIRENICPNVINTYGTTESGSWGGCTVMMPEDHTGSDRLESVGRAGREVSVRIVSPGGPVDQPLPAGEKGEIVIRGPSVANRLWEQPDLARRIFDGPWWRSGDIGWLDSDGYLFLVGRVDDMIISGGINVYPAEIEEALLSHPAVRECAVIGLPSERWGQQVTAFIVRDGDIDAEKLQAHLAGTSLGRYKRPREYRFVDDLPRGNTGKVNRKLLKQSVLGP